MFVNNNVSLKGKKNNVIKCCYITHSYVIISEKKSFPQMSTNIYFVIIVSLFPITEHFSSNITYVLQTLYLSDHSFSVIFYFVKTITHCLIFSIFCTNKHINYTLSSYIMFVLKRIFRAMLRHRHECVTFAFS